MIVELKYKIRIFSFFLFLFLFLYFIIRKISRHYQVIFQTSTPKQQCTRIPLPRSSTPNKFYNRIKYKIRDNDDHIRWKSQNFCYYYQVPIIKLDLLLYRPQTESYHHRNSQQIWNI